MTRQVGNGGFVQAGAGIDVDCVDDIVGCFQAVYRRIRSLVLTSRRKQEASIRRECQSSEERGESFVCVDVGILDSDAKTSRKAW